MPSNNGASSDAHTQFCSLVGIKPCNTTDTPAYRTWSDSLYARVEHEHHIQARWYRRTAYISNFLLVGQIVVGALLTALGASGSPGTLIAVFGAISTIIAGGITYMKGRGQPMRARAFRDELALCLNTIKDVEAQFLGISNSANGYGPIATSETVELEVRRLAGMYATALDNARRNYPDLWVRADDVASDRKSPIAGMLSRGQTVVPGHEKGIRSGPDLEDASGGAEKQP